MRARLFAALLVSAVTAACSADSNSIEVTAPSSAKCQVTVENALTGVIPPEGAASTIAVTTNRDCTWTAASEASWISITAQASGQGSGTIGYRVAPNGEHAQRRGTIDVNNSEATIVQDAAPCRFSVTPASATVPAGGATLTETVEAPGGCAWTAASPVNWIVVTSKTSGDGAGSVTLAVATNPGAARTSAVTIAGQTVTIQQSAAAAEPPPPTPCTFSLSSSSQDVGADSATFSVNVTAESGCAWNASSQAPWITVAAGASGTGSGTVTLRVAANTGTSRTGTATIAGKTFTVNQAAVACTFEIEPGSQSVPAEGGAGTVRVTTASACAWTATSQAAWITITGGSSGSGNGSVSFTAAPNTGAARTGTLTIAGKTFTVAQSAPSPACTFSIAPSSQNISDAGGSGSTAVTASSGACTWTATSNASWITITRGASGTGNGTVEYAVAANTGASRSGALTIGGQTLTVNQAAAPPPCTWSIAPTSQDVSDAGGTGSVAVTASAATCAWTAKSNADWIAIVTGSSGAGNGTVTFAAVANTGAARTGTLTIAGQTFTVNQAAVAPPCTFSISPTAATVPAGGGAGSIAITASAATCAWTASGDAEWVTITSLASGVGSGTIAYIVAPNAGPARTATITAAGQPFTISQSSP